MSPLFRKLAKGVVIFVLVCFALVGAGLSFLHSPFFRYPAEGEYPPPRINELIWPTIGYPAMITPGEELTVELDLWTGEESKGEEVSEWHAYLIPSRDDLEGLVYELEPEDALPRASEHWPYRSVEGRSEEVWHASFGTPRDAVPDLYDLHIEVDETLSVRVGHDISEEVKQRILETIPAIKDVVVHLEPHGSSQTSE